MVQPHEEEDAEFQFWRTPQARFGGDLQGRKLYGVSHRPKPKCVVGNINAYGMEGPPAILRPTSWTDEQCDGAFLVDSFYYLKRGGKKAKPVEYFPALLQRLWEQTGFVFFCCLLGWRCTRSTLSLIHI